MSEWKHISTCPENRTVLLYSPSDGIGIGFFDQYIRDWAWQNTFWSSTPTHWMLLPERPTPQLLSTSQT